MIGLLMLAGELFRGAQAPRLQPMAPRHRELPLWAGTSSPRDSKFVSARAPKPAGEAPVFPRTALITRGSLGRQQVDDQIPN